MAGSSSLDKTLGKLQASISSGSFYEAQQMLKTVHARHRNKRAYDASYRLAEEGARMQLNKGQLTCGVEMAMVLVEGYLEDSAAGTQENFERLLSVYCAFPEPNSARAEAGGSGEGTAGDNWPVKECINFLMTGVKWAARCGSAAQVQQLHGKAAEYIWHCLGVEGLGWATMHFIRGDNKESFANALFACMEKGNPEEEDLFICRACLQTLAVATAETSDRQLKGSEDLLIALGMMRGGLPLPDTPLMHLTNFFIKALKKRSLPLEKMLKERYARVLKRDELLLGLIARIEQVYLGVQPPRSGGGLEGMLGGMMRSMFSGDVPAF